tara:strand:+ start:5056 stop:5520 length:465 start_codon:yes stop_codon:yes gene_type:complete
MKDLSNNISPAVSLAAATRTAAANGTGVDLQGYESATVLVDVGAEGDTLSSSVYFEVSLEESDDDSTYTDVAQASIVDGTISSGGIFLKLDGTANGNPDSTGGIFRVGYVGNSRYIRVVLAKTGTHSNGTPLGAMVVRGSARHSSDNAFTAHNA